MGSEQIITDLMTLLPDQYDPITSIPFNSTDGFNEFSNLTNLNHTIHEYISCPSIQMPVGNMISMILYTIVCIIGLFGNTLVIYVVIRFSKMQTVTNMYILNLAIADECFLIGIPFLIITMYLGEWSFGTTACKAYMVSTSITQFTSSIFLFIMSADRYIAVCHPISSTRFRSPFVSKIVTALAWTMSAVIMLPVILYASTHEKPNNKMTCIIKWPDQGIEDSETTFTLYAFILGFAIPLTLILGFYYLVIRKLRTVGPKSKSKEKKRSHRKVSKLVLTVITVYVLCWLPYWASQVALINSDSHICKTRLEITIFLLVACLGYSNSAMNPILYAFLSDNFKKSFLKACTCTVGKDFNTQLQVENSLFPRFGKKGSEKGISTSKQTIPQTGITGSNILIAGGDENNIRAITNTESVIPDESATLFVSVPMQSITKSTDTLSLAAAVNVSISSPMLSPTPLHNVGIGSDSRPPVLHTDL